MLYNVYNSLLWVIYPRAGSRHQSFHVLRHYAISFRFWYVYPLSLFIIQSRVLHLGLPICFFPFFLLHEYFLTVYHLASHSHDLSTLLDVH